MIGPGLQLRRDAEIGAKEAAAEFGNAFLPRPLRAIFCIAAEIAPDS